MEGAPLSCWVCCVDVGFVWLFQVSAGVRVWPGQAVSFFCVSPVVLFGSRISRPGPGDYTLSHFSRPVRLAWLKYLCLSPCCVVVVASCRRSPAGWLFPHLLLV